jgi:hypothetical protein
MAGLAISLPSHAATLEQIVQTVAPLAQATATAPGWATVDRLGVKWHKRSPVQGPMGYTKFGTVKLDGLGKTDVTFIGSRADLRTASLHLPEDKVADKTEFDATLKRLLPAARIKQVRAGCKNEGVMGGSAVYQVVLPGHRPAYVLMMAAVGKRLETGLDIAAQFAKDWNCTS